MATLSKDASPRQRRIFATLMAHPMGETLVYAHPALVGVVK